MAASWEHLNCRLDPWLSCDLGGNGGSDLMPVLATPDALGWPKGKRKKKKKKNSVPIKEVILNEQSSGDGLVGP